MTRSVPVSALAIASLERLQVLLQNCGSAATFEFSKDFAVTDPINHIPVLIADADSSAVVADKVIAEIEASGLAVTVDDAEPDLPGVRGNLRGHRLEQRLLDP